MSKLRVKLKKALEDSNFTPGPDYGQTSMIRYFSNKAKEEKCGYQVHGQHLLDNSVEEI